jgi:hypothetical protein
MNKAQRVVMGFLVSSVIVIAILFMISIREVPQGSCEVTAYRLSESAALNLSGTMLYSGVTCPHCKIVEEFIKNNSIDSKLNITQKEVFENKTNADELIALGKACGVSANTIGAVPMMYSNGLCYLGDVDIICVLKNLTGVK